MNKFLWCSAGKMSVQCRGSHDRDSHESLFKTFQIET